MNIRLISPAFYTEVLLIRFHDPLADFLRALRRSIFVQSYPDVVKLANHFWVFTVIPYALTHLALHVFYPDEMPERKGIWITLSARVTGAIANVISAITMITGTVDEGGLSERNGRFQRYHLLNFSVEQLLSLRFSGLDNDATTNASA